LENAGFLGDPASSAGQAFCEKFIQKAEHTRQYVSIFEWIFRKKAPKIERFSLQGDLLRSKCESNNHTAIGARILGSAI